MMPHDHASRGRHPDRTPALPALGRREFARRVWGEVSDSNIFLVAGGVTYSIVLALFPGLAALVSIYGLLLDPAQIERQVNSMSTLLPDQTRQLIAEQLHAVVSSSSGSLGAGLAVSLLLALWTASRGMSGLITGINIAYEAKETRSFLRFNLLALLLTIGVIIGGLIAVALVGVLPAVVQSVGLHSVLRWVMLIVEWPLLIMIVLAGLAVLYRYAPNRDDVRWRLLSPGALAATALWISGSIAFTVYVANFASYNKTYGSLAGAVVLLTWLYLSALVVLLGAIINAQADKHTRGEAPAGKP